MNIKEFGLSVCNNTWVVLLLLLDVLGVHSREK